MKTITKKMLALGLIGLVIVVAGCEASNEKNMMESGGKPTGPGVTSPNAAKTPGEFVEKNPSAPAKPGNAEKYKEATK